MEGAALRPSGAVRHPDGRTVRETAPSMLCILVVSPLSRRKYSQYWPLSTPSTKGRLREGPGIGSPPFMAWLSRCMPRTVASIDRADGDLSAIEAGM